MQPQTKQYINIRIKISLESTIILVNSLTRFLNGALEINLN